jgi:hypothetical protein
MRAGRGNILERGIVKSPFGCPKIMPPARVNNLNSKFRQTTERKKDKNGCVNCSTEEILTDIGNKLRPRSYFL